MTPEDRAAVEAAYTEQQIVDAAIYAEIPDSKLESLLIELNRNGTAHRDAQAQQVNQQMLEALKKCVSATNFHERLLAVARAETVIAAAEANKRGE